MRDGWHGFAKLGEDLSGGRIETGGAVKVVAELGLGELRLAVDPRRQEFVGLDVGEEGLGKSGVGRVDDGGKDGFAGVFDGELDFRGALLALDQELVGIDRRGGADGFGAMRSPVPV
ncbi:MAG: hypothetical protein QM760_19860 [Nibricoccus sp.]